MPLQDKYPKSSPLSDSPTLSLEDPEIILKFILSGTRGPCTRRPLDCVHPAHPTVTPLLIGRTRIHAMQVVGKGMRCGPA